MLRMVIESVQWFDSFGAGDPRTSSKEPGFPCVNGPGLYRPQGHQSLTEHSFWFIIIITNPMSKTHATKGAVPVDDNGCRNH